MIWPFVKVCEESPLGRPTWDGLRAVWRRVLNADGTVLRHAVSVTLLPSIGSAIVAKDGPKAHDRLVVFGVDDLRNEIGQRPPESMSGALERFGGIAGLEALAAREAAR